MWEHAFKRNRKRPPTEKTACSFRGPESHALMPKVTCAGGISLPDARRGCQGLDCRPSLLSSTEGNGPSLYLIFLLIYHLYLVHWWTGGTCSILTDLFVWQYDQGIDILRKKCYFHRSKGWRNNYMSNLVNLFIFYELAPSCFADFKTGFQVYCLI